MRFRQSLKISWRAIASHKLRSTLTTLGVIIGVGAVITFMILGGAIAADFTSEFEDLYGEDAVLIVQTETPLEGGFGIAFSQAPIYTEHDIEQLEQMEGVSFVGPIGQVDSVQTTYRDQRLTGAIEVRATTATGFAFDEFEEGGPFEMGANETVLNSRASRLYGGVEVSDQISYTTSGGERITLTVTGIIVEEFLGQPPTMYVPTDPYYTTVVETPRDTTERAYPFLMIGAESLDDLPGVQERVTAYLHGESDANALKGPDDTIQIQTIDDLVGQILDLVDQLTIFVAGIAAIALVVGAIGIANIMIVSVVERTREIGIMKAVGATNREIVQLFLVESVILGIIGAFVGVAVGVGIGLVAVSALGWPMVYPIEWIVVAVVMGVGVGVVAGLYPAWRAARVDPIVALSRE